MGALSNSSISLFLKIFFLLCRLSLSATLHALTLRPARRLSDCCYILLLCLDVAHFHPQLSNPHLWEFCLQCNSSSLSPVSLTCCLVLIFLQSESILRHWHADYIIDPGADQWPLHIKGGLAPFLGPSWPILALIRWLPLLANERGATP